MRGAAKTIPAQLPVPCKQDWTCWELKAGFGIFFWVMVPGLGDVLESSLIQDLLEQLLEGFQAKETHCCSLFLGK